MLHVKAQIDKDEKTGKVAYQITHSMDATPALEAALKARKLEEDRLNKKNEIRPQARLPMTEVMNIKRRYGIDPLNVKPDQETRFWQILQTEYPRFLSTNKKVYRVPRLREKIRFMPGTLGA